MKKLFFLPILAFVAFSITSCDEDESLNPIPPKIDGQFMRLDITNRQILFNDSNSFFGGTLSSPSGNVVKYELYIKRVKNDGAVFGNYVLLDTYTSFPIQMTITAEKIADAFDVPVSELGDGEIYRFLGYSYDASGVKTSYLNLSRSVQVANFVKQAYRFNTSLTNDPKEDYNNRDGLL